MDEKKSFEQSDKYLPVWLVVIWGISDIILVGFQQCIPGQINMRISNTNVRHQNTP